MEKEVFDSPTILKKVEVGKFLLLLNSLGEIRISTKHSDTAFVVEDNLTEEFFQQLGKLQIFKKTSFAKLFEPVNKIKDEMLGLVGVSSANDSFLLDWADRLEIALLRIKPK